MDSTRRILAAVSGIQGGKSSLGALWLMEKIFLNKDPKAAFLITSPTYKLMQQSTLPCLMGIWPTRMYEWKRQESILKLSDGRIVYLRTGTDPNAAEGIQNVSGIWLDEAGMCSKLFWYNLEARTSFKQAQILITSTPYAMNWLKRDVIDQYEKNKREDILYVRWRSTDNPAFPKEEFERQRQILPANIFRRKYEGVHEKMEGLVFENLTGDNFCQPFVFPKGTRYFAGVDWGFKHAFAISIRAITPDGFNYCISEFKQSGLDPQEKVAMMKSKSQIFNVEHIYCGADRPEMIDMFNDAGLKASSFYMDSDKRYRGVIPQIEAHAELIKTRRYKIFSDCCPHLEDEYETYHWPEPKEDDRIREVPVDINDDLISAERYVTVGTLHITKKSAIQLPDKLVASPSRDVWNPSKRGQAKAWNAY